MANLNISSRNINDFQQHNYRIINIIFLRASLKAQYKTISYFFVYGTFGCR